MLSADVAAVLYGSAFWIALTIASSSSPRLSALSSGASPSPRTPQRVGSTRSTRSRPLRSAAAPPDSERQRGARFEDANIDTGRELGRMPEESFRRFRGRVLVPRRKGAPVNRDRYAWLQELQSLRGA